MIFDTVKCRHCSTVYKVSKSHEHMCEGKKDALYKSFGEAADGKKNMGKAE